MERDLVFTENRTASTNWMMATLSDVADVTISNVDKKTKPGEIPIRLCNYTDVYYNQHIRSNIDFMSATATDREIARCSLFKGDVVITKDSEKDDDIGIPAYISENIDGLVCGYHLVILRPKPEKINGAYLFYSLNSRETEHQFHARANGVTRFGLRKADIGTVTVPLPPLAEQRRIAHILGTLDDKIELNRRMNETLEEMARAIFKDWFVDFGPVRAKMEGREAYLPEEIWRLFPDRLVESELGEVPEGWGVKSLDEIANYRNGLALQKFRPEPNEERLPVVKIAQLRSGVADSREWSTANIIPECVIDDGDVVFSWSGSLLVKVWTGGRAALNQHLFKVTSEDYPKWFYLHFTKHHLAEFQSIAADKTTTMGHIKRQHLKEAKCAVPDREMISLVHRVIGKLVEQSISNDIVESELGELRDALLPELVSGQVETNGFKS